MNPLAPAQMMSLAGRRALVTGASRGIGAAIARLFGAAGADVAVHFHSRRDRAEEVARDIAAAGSRAVVLQADLARPGSGAALARDATASLGAVDILVLNAAEQRRAAVSDVSPDDYALQVETGFGSALGLVGALLPAMRRARFGRIIAIGSVQQFRPNPELPVYAAMKAALANLMRSMAKPSAGDGVTCNTIQPGLIDTDRNDVWRENPTAYAALLERIPAHRPGLAEEIAALALYLAGPMGGYTTGAEILVDGGLALP